MEKSNHFAFIDSQNLNLAILDSGWKLDFKKFRIYLKDKYKITEAYLFLGYLKENKSMYDFLSQIGYKLIFKPILRSRTGKIKGNIDAELVLHTMIEYPNFDQAVIITGDGDFYCLLEYLNSKEKFLKLLIPNVHKYSALLKSVAAGKIDFMNNLKNKLEYKNERQLHKDKTL